MHVQFSCALEPPVQAARTHGWLVALKAPKPRLQA
jgi:hypothetical protein